jgi:hypothetical protein
MKTDDRLDFEAGFSSCTCSILAVLVLRHCKCCLLNCSNDIPGEEEEHTASSLYPPQERRWVHCKFQGDC